MIRVDAATVLLQWAAGGLFFLWFTTRRRVVGVGYGWLLRGTYLLLAVAAAAAGFQFGVFRTFFWGYKILKEAEKGYWDRDGQLSG